VPKYPLRNISAYAPDHRLQPGRERISSAPSVIIPEAGQLLCDAKIGQDIETFLLQS